MPTRSTNTREHLSKAEAGAMVIVFGAAAIGLSVASGGRGLSSDILKGVVDSAKFFYDAISDNSSDTFIL